MTLSKKEFIESVAAMYDLGDSIELIMRYIRDNLPKVKEE